MRDRLCGFAIVLLICFCGQGQAAERFESWLSLGVGQRLDYGLEAKVFFQNRLADEGALWHRFQVAPELVWHYSPRYDFSVGYKWTNTFYDNHTSQTWHEGLFSGTVKFPIEDWKITSRQRFQFGFRDSETTGLFRQLTRVNYLGEWIPLRLRPFIANEWFYDLMDGFVSQNRFFGGLAYEVNSVWAVEIWGMRRDLWTLTDVHSSHPVFGMTMKIHF